MSVYVSKAAQVWPCPVMLPFTHSGIPICARCAGEAAHSIVLSGQVARTGSPPAVEDLVGERSAHLAFRRAGSRSGGGRSCISGRAPSRGGTDPLDSRVFVESPSVLRRPNGASD